MATKAPFLPLKSEKSFFWRSKSIESFKQILDILYEYDFSFVEGYKEFKDKVLNLDKSIMYTSYWGQDLKLESYLEKLGK